LIAEPLFQIGKRVADRVGSVNRSFTASFGS
jgi:hypothetical protein